MTLSSNPCKIVVFTGLSRSKLFSQYASLSSTHFQDSGQSYHVVDYDPETGAVIAKKTWQGLADESAWARGQAWGLYGFTMSHRESQQPEFLEHALKVA